MEVLRFTDQYELVAPVYRVSPEELRQRDERQTQVLQRWIAVSDGQAVGAVSTWLRPDDRLFLYFVGPDRGAWATLTQAIAETVNRRVHTFVDADDGEAIAALQAAGFETEVVGERFRVEFAEALARADRAWIPNGFSIHPADTVDEDRLFTLDNTIRQDVPGLRGVARRPRLVSPGTY